MKPIGEEPMYESFSYTVLEGEKYIVDSPAPFRPIGKITTETLKTALSSPSDIDVTENGVYISKAFDSMQNETVWHRMRLNISAPASAVYRLKIYAGDTSEISIAVPGKSGLSKVDINEYINDPSIDINRKLDMFDDIGATCYENFTDILMYNLKGRYLWFCMEFINYEENQLKINSIKIELPQVTFMDYLPEYYRKNSERNSFLERFIGIYQSI